MAKHWALVRRFFRNSNKPLLLLCFLSSVCSGFLNYSAGAAAGFSNQLLASVAGFTIALLLSLADYEKLCRLWPLFAASALFLVFLTFTPLGYTVAGTDDTAWLGFPLGADAPLITFQPSEWMKIAFIVTFSVHLARFQSPPHRLSAVLGLCAHGITPAVLVFLQGDDGTALVFLCMFAAMLFAAGVHRGYFIGAAAAAVPAALLLWPFLDEQKTGRIMALIRPEEYLETYGWQQHHALISIGNGGLCGTGYLNGGAVSLYARNNDFIFTEAAEEFGLIGALTVLLLLFGVILSLLFAALRARNLLGRFLCVGMLAMIAFQSIINIGMNLRLLPVIGITLPFFSAGGSAVLTLYCGIGLALGVSLQSRASIFTRHHP